MSFPSKKILVAAHPPSAKVVSAPMSPGAAAVTVVRGDVIGHVQPGWHVCVAPAGAQVTVPIGGLTAGASDDSFHWCQGPSYSGSGVSQPSGTTQDTVNSGVGTDGRTTLDGTTYGGATGSSTGGVSGQSTGAGNSGGGGGSASRGF
jgi:hypothetical protein